MVIILDLVQTHPVWTLFLFFMIFTAGVFSWPGMLGPALTVRLLAKFDVRLYKKIDPYDTQWGKLRKIWKKAYLKSRSKKNDT